MIQRSVGSQEATAHFQSYFDLPFKDVLTFFPLHLYEDREKK